ncbi:hypothetical protein [Deinococcus detaillensis]|uniref:hypothetical protein n=1 Tax=Deinococcus detaillensis TaxID=2592048 RepID=UPI00163D85B2|nr:hypothetical protein [Deinococcus detaillensis]
MNITDRVCLSCINRAISDEIDLTTEQQDFASMCYKSPVVYCQGATRLTNELSR